MTRCKRYLVPGYDAAASDSFMAGDSFAAVVAGSGFTAMAAKAGKAAVTAVVGLLV